LIDAISLVFHVVSERKKGLLGCFLLNLINGTSLGRSFLLWVNQKKFTPLF